MLDRDLAKLYGAEVKVLNQAVKRNINRFPLDLMFQLNSNELTRNPPHAFNHLRRLILKNENLMMELKNNDHLSTTFFNFEKRIKQDLI